MAFKFHLGLLAGGDVARHGQDGAHTSIGIEIGRQAPVECHMTGRTIEFEFCFVGQPCEEWLPDGLFP